MALYKFKEFLDFNDIVDYFRDFKVYNAPLGYSEHARNRIKGILLEFIQTGKLTPVFYYDGIVKEDFELDSMSFYIKAWICVNEKIVKDLFFDNELGAKTIDLNIKDYLKVHKVGKNITYGVNYQKKIDKMEGFIFMDTNRYKIELDGGDFFDEDNLPQEPKTQAEKRMEILYEILDDMKLRAEQDPNANISLDDYKDKLPKTIKNDIWLTFDDLLYPKSQLDAIFNPTQTTTETNTLQTQLDQAHARIAELEKMVEQSKTTTAPIFDSQDSYTYPPELDMAIKIWVEIYQTDNIPKHFTNHSDKFTQACKNLGFAFTENAIETRLKKVTTPQSQKEKTKNKNSLK